MKNLEMNSRAPEVISQIDEACRSLNNRELSRWMKPLAKSAVFLQSRILSHVVPSLLSIGFTAEDFVDTFPNFKLRIRFIELCVRHTQASEVNVSEQEMKDFFIQLLFLVKFQVNLTHEFSETKFIRSFFSEELLGSHFEKLKSTLLEDADQAISFFVSLGIKEEVLHHVRLLPQYDENLISLLKEKMFDEDYLSCRDLIRFCFAVGLDPFCHQAFRKQFHEALDHFSQKESGTIELLELYEFSLRFFEMFKSSPHSLVAAFDDHEIKDLLSSGTLNSVEDVEALLSSKSHSKKTVTRL